MKKLPLTLLAGSLFFPVAHGQDNVPIDEDDEEVIELSPFVVEAGTETGYLATNTLAGTRLKTSLKEIGAAVSVYTPEFLNDIAATDVEDILTYTASTEGGGINGNFAGISGESPDEVRDNPSAINRVRAFAGATRTRDYFESPIPSDAFSFSNVTISRGPNAILAGIGSAGGVIDASLRKAVFNDSTRLVLRLGEHGSHREEFHVNREIVKDRFAFRLAAMNEEENYQQKPAHEQDRRVYAATTIRLRESNRESFLGRTTLRANYENGAISGTPPNLLTPVFSVQSWFPGIDPRDGEPFAAPKWRVNGALRQTLDADGNVVPNNVTIQGFPLFRNWGLIYSDPTSGAADFGLPGELSSIQGHMGVIPGGAGSPRGYTRGTGDRNRERAGFVRTRLLNPDVFDFYNNLLTGAFDNREQDFDAFDVRLEQLLFNGKAGFEMAYNHQEIIRKRDFPISGDNEIFIDTTEILSIRTDAFNEGGPVAEQFIENPHFGRPFVISRDVFRDQVNTADFESFQINAFAKHDFTRGESLLGDLLGRHTLSGLFFRTRQYTSNETFSSTWDPDGELNFVSSLAAQPGDFRAQVNAAFYIGDSQINAATEDDIRLTPIRTSRPEFGETYTLRVWDPGLRAFVTGTSRPLRILDNVRRQREDVESVSLSLQSHWLDDHVVTTVGWREDQSDTFTSPDPPRLPDGNLDASQLTLVPASSQEEESWTKSVVVKFPEAYLFDLPLDSELRGYWNYSENFNPVGQRRNVWNEEIGSPVARTSEYGVMLSMFKGKFDLRVNWFESKINGANVPVGNPYGYINALITRMVGAEVNGLDPQDPALEPGDADGFEHTFTPVSFETFEEVARAFYATLPERLAVNIGPEFNFNPQFVSSDGTFGWEPDNIVNRASPSNVVSTGTEIELVWNPTPSWRMALNVVKNEAVLADIGKAELEFIDVWLENVRTQFNGELFEIVRNPGSNQSRWLAQYQNEHISDIRAENALSGTASPEIRKWRANFVTRYRFRNGFLKGASLGGAIRWQDNVGIGYPLIDQLDENGIDTGNNVADVNNPYYGPEELYVDLNLGYTRKLRLGGTKPLDWTISLNVRNIFGEDELIPIRANADGSVGTVRIAPVKTWRLTNSIRF